MSLLNVPLVSRRFGSKRIAMEVLFVVLHFVAKILKCTLIEVFWFLYCSTNSLVHTKPRLGMLGLWSRRCWVQVRMITIDHTSLKSNFPPEGLYIMGRYIIRLLKLTSSFLLITVVCPLLFLTDQAPKSDLPRHNAIEGEIRPPNPDLPGQNAIEDQTRLEQYQFRSLITRISVITKRRIVIAFRMYSFEFLLFFRRKKEREKYTP